MANVELIRNVVLCGHGSAGKTTLADKFLTLTNTVSGSPSVDDETSICDFDPEEKHHKYSIEAAMTHFQHDGKRFNVIDTPGYPDFIGQVIGCMRAADTAAIVVNAGSGIEVNTRRVFKEAEAAGIGRMIIINKMDADNIDFEGLVAGLQEMWGARCVLLNVPIGSGENFKGVASTLHVPENTEGALIDPQSISEPLVESIIEVDDAVMERYFEGTQPTDAELSKLIVQAVKAGTLIPIVCCSSKTGDGVKEVLDAINLCGLSPADNPPTFGDQLIEPKADGPLCGLVFRTRIDPFVQKLSFIRLYSGTLKRDDSVPASTARKDVKMGQLLTVQGETTEPIESAGPGEIVAVAKIDDFHTGTSLGTIEIPEIKFPMPMVSLAVSPKSRGDETKLSGALNKVVEEDPTFHLDRDPQTKELVVTGMSELHLNVIQERLIRRDKLEVETKQPRIAFRETIQAKADGSYRHKKQSGGRGQVWRSPHSHACRCREIRISKSMRSKANFNAIKDSHYDEKSNFLWVDSVVGGVIPGNFMPAIGKGFAERITSGVIAGYPVQDVCIEVHFGKHHPVDSSEAAFKMAAKQVFKKVFEQAKPSLLEPVVSMNITVPESNVGDVYSDMSSRGGRVSGSDPAGGNFTIIHAEVPLREVTTYSRTLSSMTGGMGSYTMEFSHYDIMPGNIQQDVISKATIADDDEE